jgi:hypothetical protein
MLNITNIPAPRVPLIDERTGLMSREWYRFFLNLFTITGSGGNQTNLDDLQVGPAVSDFSSVLTLLNDLQQQPESEGQYATLITMVQDAMLSIPTAYIPPSAYASPNGLTMATSRLLGRTSTGNGSAEEITVGSGLTLSAGTLSGTGGTVTSVTATAPIVSSGGATPDISIPAATTSVNGYLTSTDWTTFNSKQAALVSGTNIKTVNGTTLLGSGDLGAITPAYGGTGLVTYTVGDILYASGATTLSKLSDVATGNALISGGVSTAPSWGKIGLTTHVSGTLGTANGGTNLTSFTTNGVVYATSTSALTTNANFVWDGTSLGMGTSAYATGVFYNKSLNGLVYFDVANPSTAAFSDGVLYRLISSNDAGTGTASVDMVKYKIGTFAINNNESSANASISYSIAGVEAIKIDSGRNFYIETTATTASAANTFIDTTTSPAGQVKRSTSSIRYKNSVETLDQPYADAILTARPVWYRSSSPVDNPHYSWYGLIAEELAEIDPRLVHWGYIDSDYDIIVTQEKSPGENGIEMLERRERRLKDDATLKPDGVQYERVSVLLLDVVRRMKEDLDAVKAELATLKGA